MSYFRDLMMNQGGGIPEWIVTASTTYMIPQDTIVSMYEKYGDAIMYGVSGNSYLQLTSGQGGDMGVQMTNSTTITLCYCQDKSADTHVAGMSKSANSTSCMVLCYGSGNTKRLAGAKSDSTTDYTTCRNVRVAHQVIFGANNYDMVGKVYWFRMLKDNVATHFWIPFTDKTMLDLCTDTKTSWSASSYTASL